MLGTPVQVAPAPESATTTSPGVESLPVDSIVPGRFQPRRRFDESSLSTLAESIRLAGVMQPVLVRRIGSQGPISRFELVAGERRWRASQMAGLTTIPALVVELTDVEAAQWGLIENLQRDDLGTMERAAALAALARDFRLTHAQIAERVGLDRSSVTNLIRLTELEPAIQSLIDSSRLSAGHGKALLAVAPGPARVSMAEKAALGSWSVRRLEQFSTAFTAAEAAGGLPTLPAPTADEVIGEQARIMAVREMERRLQEHLGTKVTIRTDRTGQRGRLVIRFYGLDQFEGILGRMGANPRI